ncbi:DHA2 family efflux MFS transporter permease subunit [Methylomicrobium sp. Wu6]|uniref:DHA2 family efflux MFS transporter permease subunit n=1 Tax=Methylomicrobium sp. Wu6 TaxID=3107928 RepID=UPI002DD6A0A0|nr:DHA2 family efflux MFS transporter permease subunit [Methylomicrobium sp. Wu6]MEC4748465.1 DHA2 family efflux MFS transporter permease subunit [Methylomicrobium sp. Wu6]
MAITYAERLSGWRFILFNVLLALGHMIVLFNVGSYIAMMPHVAGDLGGVTPSFGTWAQTDFMMALALAFPLSRWLSGKYGAYRVFVAAFFVYAFASYLCAISESLWLFIPGRVLLGFAGGITLPVGQSLLLKEYPDKLKMLALGIWGLVTLMPFTISFSIGGVIVDEVGWRRLFYLNTLIALVIAATTGSLLAGRGFERSYIRFDFIGFMLLAVVLGGIQTILNQGNDFDWFDSPFLRAMAILVIVVLPCFIIWELGERHPALDIRLFAHRNFAVGVICFTVGFLLIQGLLSMFIVQLQVLLGYSSFLASMVFLPMIVLAVPVTLIMHGLPLNLDARLLACINLLGFALALFWIGLFDEPASFDQIFWPMLLFGLFLGSFFIPLTRLTLHGFSGQQEMRAAEGTGLLRIAAGAFGITLQGIVLFRRMPFHQLHLADNFGGRRFASIDLLQELSGKLDSAGVAAEMVKSELMAIIKQHAAILAMNDAFLLASYLFVGLAGLVWLAYPAYPHLHPSKIEKLEDIRAEEMMEEP